jgi:PhzF family phenazine biosynthesis protein
MSELRLFHVDAFTGRLFGGNAAAVVPLDAWLDDDVMLAIANENNLSETAFFVPSAAGYALRWFTPTVEVRLCGHATLATAFVLFAELTPRAQSVVFETASGALSVRRLAGERLQMTFPRWHLTRVGAVPDALIDGLGAQPAEVLAVDTGDNYFVVFDSESDVLALRPDFARLESLHPAGVIVTAPGTQSDCVCRYFAPSYGIPEDPGTGSIHCALTPYWAEKLDKTAIHSLQVSARGAELYCELTGEATLISGRAVKYLEGVIRL